MTNKKAGIFGALGILAAVALPGGATALLLLKGFAIGFSIGSFLFPPEIDSEDDEASIPTVDPQAPIPLVWGLRTVPGNIIYFRPGKPLKRSSKEDEYTYQQMQVAVCMGDILRLAFILDNTGEQFAQKGYFAYTTKYPMASKPDNKPLDTVPEMVRLSQVQWSDGGNPKYFFDYFTDYTLGFVPPPAVIGEDEGSFKGSPQNPFGDEPTDTQVLQTFSSWPTDLPRLKGVCSAASPVWYLGNRARAVPQMGFMVEVFPNMDSSTFAWQHVPTKTASSDLNVSGGILGVNAAHCAWELFTNSQWGMGKDEALLEEASWVAVEDMLEIEGLTINAMETTQLEAKEVMSKLMFHINGMLRSTSSGQLEFILLRALTLSPIVNDPLNPAAPIPGLPSVYLVNDTDVKDIDIETKTWTDVDNEFSATYSSYRAQDRGLVGPLKNEAAYQVVGTWKHASFHFDYFIGSKSTKRRLSQIFIQNSRPKIAVTCKLDLRYHEVKKGDGIILDSATFGLDTDLDFDLNGTPDAKGMIFRVMEVTDPDIESNSITIKAGIDMDSYYAAVYDEPPVSAAEDGPVLTRLSPEDMGSHVDWWQSNVSQEDVTSGFDWDLDLGASHNRPVSGTTGKPIVFHTSLYSSRGGPEQTRVGYNAVFGPSIPYWDKFGAGTLVTPIPETSAAVSFFSNDPVTKFFAYQFSLQTAIGGDDFRFSLPEDEGGKVAFISLTPASFAAFTTDRPDAETEIMGVKADSAYETGDWVMVCTGRPMNAAKVKPAYCVSEVMRFGQLERVNPNDPDDLTYKLGLIQRCANKENAQGWPAGMRVWIFKMRDLSPVGAVSDTLWPNRFMGSNDPIPSINDGLLKMRTYAQGGDDRIFETEFQGLAETHNNNTANQFAIPERANSAQSVGITAIAWRRDSVIADTAATTDVYKWEFGSGGTTPHEWTIEFMPVDLYPGLGDFQIDSGFSNPKGWPVLANQKDRVSNWTNESAAPHIGKTIGVGVWAVAKSGVNLSYITSLSTSAITGGGVWPSISYIALAAHITGLGYNSSDPKDVEAFHASLVFVFEVVWPTTATAGVKVTVPKMNSSPASVYRHNAYYSVASFEYPLE